MSQENLNTFLIVILLFGKIAHWYYTKFRFDEQESNTKYVLDIAKLHGETTDAVQVKTQNMVQSVEDKVKVVEDKVKVVEDKAEEVKQIASLVSSEVASQSGSGTKLRTVNPPKP